MNELQYVIWKNRAKCFVCVAVRESFFWESVTPSAARNSWWCYDSSGELIIPSAGFMRYGSRAEGCMPCVLLNNGSARTKSTPLTKDNRNVNTIVGEISYLCPKRKYVPLSGKIVQSVGNNAVLFSRVKLYKMDSFISLDCFLITLLIIW